MSERERMYVSPSVVVTLAHFVLWRIDVDSDRMLPGPFYSKWPAKIKEMGREENGNADG